MLNRKYWIFYIFLGNLVSYIPCLVYYNINKFYAGTKLF